MNKKSKARRQPRRRPAARKVPEKPSRSRLRLIIAAAAAVVLAISGIVIYQLNRPQPVAAAPSAAPADGQLGRTVQENSRRLNDVPNAKATFVEFLDFECEACGSVYPAIEQIRETYGDRVAFVIRYFPLEGHFNSQRAARAVEAAAQQGKLVEMYKLMFETQREWGEQQVPMDALFRQYAQRLGLDLAKWDAAYSAQSTLDRIQQDIDDGKALGVQGTPAFFLNGKLIKPQTTAELTGALDQALAA